MEPEAQIDERLSELSNAIGELYTQMKQLNTGDSKKLKSDMAENIAQLGLQGQILFEQLMKDALAEAQAAAASQANEGAAEEVLECNLCGQSNPVDAVSCGACGTKLEEQDAEGQDDEHQESRPPPPSKPPTGPSAPSGDVECSACGLLNPASTSKCTVCGAGLKPLSEPAHPPPTKPLSFPVPDEEFVLRSPESSLDRLPESSLDMLETVDTNTNPFGNPTPIAAPVPEPPAAHKSTEEHHPKSSVSQEQSTSLKDLPPPMPLPSASETPAPPCNSDAQVSNPPVPVPVQPSTNVEFHQPNTSAGPVLQNTFGNFEAQNSQPHIGAVPEMSAPAPTLTDTDPFADVFQTSPASVPAAQGIPPTSHFQTAASLHPSQVDAFSFEVPIAQSSNTAQQSKPGPPDDDDPFKM